MSDRTYYHSIDGKEVPDEESMAAYLIDEGVLFLSTATNYDNKKCIGLFININDYFYPGGDAECVTYSELPMLFNLYREKKYVGVVEFVANKRGISSLQWQDPNSDFQQTTHAKNT